MKRTSFAFLLVPSLIVAAVACSSSNPITPPADAGPDAHAGTDSGVDSGVDSGHDTGTPDTGSDANLQADCGAIQFLPAILTLARADGSPITCDATFELVDADGGAQPGSGDLGATLCGSTDAGSECTSPPDAGAGTCSYALLALQTGVAAATPVDIRVSEPGYESAVVTGIVSGVGGCVPSRDPSVVVVKLEAIDAGGDGATGNDP